jgi:RNA polymerase primary sigma factor
MTKGTGAATDPQLLPTFHDPGGPPAVDALTMFLAEVGRYPLLTASQEVELAKRIERGDKGAKDRMINSNLRLVVSIARRYQSQQLALLDVIQEGILGLIRATEKFDWRRGHKFSTYAVWWIREAIDRGVANRARIIRMPVYMVERERKVRSVERTLTAELGREPSDEEIAEEAKLPMEQVSEVREVGRPVMSLDLPVGEGEDSSLGDLLVGDEAGPEEEVELSMREESLRNALARLPESERAVIELRFGIDGDPNTIDQVVERLGLSRDRVRRIEARALAQLAHTPELEALNAGP